MMKLRFSLLGVHGELVLSAKAAAKLRDRLSEALAAPEPAGGEDAPASKPPPPPPKGPQPPPRILPY